MFIKWVVLHQVPKVTISKGYKMGQAAKEVGFSTQTASKSQGKIKNKKIENTVLILKKKKKQEKIG
jgi:hypothetical protein